MWLAKFLILFLSFGNLIFAQDTYYPVSAKRSKYCGKKLSDMLNLVCGGEYNGPENVGKKSDPGYSNAFEWTKTDWEGEFPMHISFQSPSIAQSLIPSTARLFRRHVRGVYDECCVNACTYNELVSYCKVKPSY